jgi:hypothetical protein
MAGVEGVIVELDPQVFPETIVNPAVDFPNSGRAVPCFRPDLIAEPQRFE